MTLKEEWIRPYETVDLRAQIEMTVHKDTMYEQVFGQSSPHVSTPPAIYYVDGFYMSLERLDTDKNGFTTDSGHRIHYLIRKPNTTDIVKIGPRLPQVAPEAIKQMAGLNDEQTLEVYKMLTSREQWCVRGFGQLQCRYNPEEGDLVTVGEKELFPYGLFLRTPSGIFYSIGNVVRDEDTDVEFMLWKPQSAQNDTGVIGIPSDLPSLRTLEFRLSRLDTAKILEEQESFLYDIHDEQRTKTKY